LRGHDLVAEHVAVFLITDGDKWKARYWYAAAHEDTGCDRTELLAVPRVIHLGEREQALNEATWVKLRNWQLEQKFASDFSTELFVQLDESQKVIGGRCFGLRPFDQQPLFGPGFAAPVVAMGGPHSQAVELGTQLLFGPLSPSDFLPLIGGNAKSKFGGRFRVIFRGAA
jgi:hypothetical protein